MLVSNLSGEDRASQSYILISSKYHKHWKDIAYNLPDHPVVTYKEARIGDLNVQYMHVFKTLATKHLKTAKMNFWSMLHPKFVLLP